MTRERINELWPVLEHWKNGGEIQVHDVVTGWLDWRDGDGAPDFGLDCRWRIKPSPKLVPLDAEDWLNGGPWWLRMITAIGTSYGCSFPIGPVSETGYVMLPGEQASVTVSPEELMAHYQRRSGCDPRGEWLACSKRESDAEAEKAFEKTFDHEP